jgi:phosphotransacetylase
MASGRASVAAPTQSINLETNSLPGLLLDEHDHFHRLIEEAKRFPPMATAVVCPDDSKSMAGTTLTEGLISPIFIGSQSKIEAAAKEAGVDISMIEIINIADSRMVAARAVELVHEKRAHAI